MAFSRGVVVLSRARIILLVAIVSRSPRRVARRRSSRARVSFFILRRRSRHFPRSITRPIPCARRARAATPLAPCAPGWFPRRANAMSVSVYGLLRGVCARLRGVPRDAFAKRRLVRMSPRAASRRVDSGRVTPGPGPFIVLHAREDAFAFLVAKGLSRANIAEVSVAGRAGLGVFAGDGRAGRRVADGRGGEVGGVLGVRVGACAGGAVEVGSDEVRRDLRDGDAGRRRRGRSQRRVESSERSRTARGDGSDAKTEPRPVGRTTHSVGRTTTAPWPASSHGTWCHPSASHTSRPPRTSHTRRRNDVLSRRILRKWASPGCAATLALMEATTRSERTGHSAWLVISPRRRSSAAIHDADTHATSRPAGVVGASWGRVDDGDAMVDADGRSERRARREVRQPSRDAPLSAPSEPRRGRAGRGRRASRKGRRRLWDPQPEKVGTTSQSLPGASFSKLAPDLKKQALPSAVTTTRVAHEPSPSSG